MPSTTDLMQNVYANFLGAYSGGAASKDAVLAFEPLGLMPGLDPGAPGAASTALEYLSSAANVLPDLSGGVFSATERTVSGAYIAILNPAQPIDPSTAGGFNASKAAAMEAYQNGAEGSLLGPYTYYPAFAAPANWYDSTVQDNWTSYAYSAGAPPPSPPIVANPRFRMMNTSAQWRITTDTPAAQQPPVTERVQSFMAMPAAQPQTLFAPPPVAHTAPPPAAKIALHGLPPTQPPVAHAAPPAAKMVLHLPPSSVFVRPPPPQIVLRSPPPAPAPAPSAAPAPAPLVANNDGAAPTLHPFFNIAFEYCLVQLRRPWKSGDFLASGGWFVPGAHVGDYASGSIGAQPAAALLLPGPPPRRRKRDLSPRFRWLASLFAILSSTQAAARSIRLSLPRRPRSAPSVLRRRRRASTACAIRGFRSSPGSATRSHSCRPRPIPP
jgi:hypothetical protein